MSSSPQTNNAEAPALVVFGLDEAGKAHASTFIENEVELATKAAALMGMKIMSVKSEVERALAARLPRGRVFASGKAFTPFTKAKVYAELEAAAPDAAVPSLPERNTAAAKLEDLDDSTLMPGAASKQRDAQAAVPQPTDWDDIRVGTIVLSAAVPGEMHWYECAVLAVQGKDRFKLRYCDWPNEPTFVRHLSEIGLLHPSHTPEPPLDVEPAVNVAA